ncbi:LPS translocon maturation chaperone LptM [Thiobacillus denitrificans]|uniref:LPS translocon maturation chaperone LptM n=1 Tax=Thiobacillus denitrificans TaxID=36861 RepID=UPI003AF3A23A
MMPSAGVSKSRSASSSTCSMRARVVLAAWLNSISVMMSRANISRMKLRTLYIVSLLLCGLGLTACGSKGDLYLPEKPPAPQRTPN